MILQYIIPVYIIGDGTLTKHDIHIMYLIFICYSMFMAISWIVSISKYFITNNFNRYSYSDEMSDILQLCDIVYIFMILMAIFINC